MPSTRPSPHALARLRAPALVAGLLGPLALPLGASELLWTQAPDYQSIVPSRAFVTSYVEDVEAADDFDIVGRIERILVPGYNYSACEDVIEGVWVRFYAWDDGDPGALQHEVFVAADDPLFSFGPGCVTTLDVVLPEPFEATGQHFVSVQLATGDSTGWHYWSASYLSPNGAPHRWRDNTEGGVWGSYPGSYYPERELAFQLWGEGPPPPPPTEDLWVQLGTYEVDLPSVAWPDPPHDVEVADDFDLQALIERVEVPWGNCYLCPYPDPTGAWVRFYAWSNGKPGALLHEEFVPADDPRFHIESLFASVELAEPFPVDGKGFVSYQLETTGPNGFALRADEVDEPTLSSLWVKEDTKGGVWEPSELAPDANLAFLLVGKSLSPAPELQPDPCGDWEVLDMPDDPALGTLVDVDVLAPDDVWAVGSDFVLRWDGAAWSEVPIPQLSGLDSPSLEAIAAVAPDDVWVGGIQELVGPDGFPGIYVLVLHWDGSTWTEVVPDDPGFVEGFVSGIEAVAPDDVWFVGDAYHTFGAGCHQPLTMHWDGSSLTGVETPCPELGCEVGGLGGYGLEAASAVSSDDIWAVGGGVSKKSSLCSFVLRYDGTSWTHVPSPEPGITRRLYDVHALASDDVWAVGEYLDGLGYHTYAIHWDGSAWTLHTGLLGGRAVHAFGPADVYSAGGNVFHWDGRAWAWVEDFDESSGLHLSSALFGLDAAGPCALWGVGREWTAADGTLPFSARHQAALYWDSGVREPCGAVTPPESIALASPPLVGGTFAAALDDPNDALGFVPGAGVTYWAVALQPAPGAPCGVSAPGLGIGAAAGELLVDLGPASLVVVGGPVAWSGPGTPAVHALAVPDDAALVGLPLHTQGLFADTATGDLVLTAGLDATVGL